MRSQRQQAREGEEKEIDESEPRGAFRPDAEIRANSRLVLDGDVSTRKLLTLIGLGREEEGLDYKRGYDLAGKRSGKDKLEVVRDVVAMANTRGGYIVLGVDEEPSSTGDRYATNGLDEEDLKALDVDVLKSQVEGYLGTALTLRLQVHRLGEFGGRSFALIHVPESPESPLVMEKSGQYAGEGGRTKAVFHQGDVYVRRGASTCKANQTDMRELFSKVRRREKERWTEEILGLRVLAERFDRVMGAFADAGSGGAQRARLAKRKADFALGASAFEELVFGMLQAGDHLGLRWYLSNAADVFYEALTEAVASGDEGRALQVADDKLGPLLDNLAVLALTCARYREVRFVKEARDAFYAVYERAYAADFGDPPKESARLRTTWVLEAVIKRVYFVGAALLHSGFWVEMPLFIRQPLRWEDPFWRRILWAFDAVWSRSRDGRLEHKSLCALVQPFVEERGWFYGAFGNNAGNLVPVLSQFDFLQCVHAVEHADEFRAAYPSFGAYPNRVTEPILAKVLDDERARTLLLPQMDDYTLAMIMKHLDAVAGREFAGLGGWESGAWTYRSVAEFLDRYPGPVPY